jgi:transglutaminase-like putative cysteine protease
MKRRSFLGAAALAVLPWRKLAAAEGAAGASSSAAGASPSATEAGWRSYEVKTRAEILRPQGVSRAWLPLPLESATDWQRFGGNTWSGNAKKMQEVTVGRYGVKLLAVEWAEGTKDPVVELTSRFMTRDRAVDLSRKDAPSLSSKEAALYTAPTDYIPCDGIVRETALLRAAKGAKTDFEKGHAIYEWVVQNTVRDPKTKGCGTGNVKSMVESGNFGGKCADINGIFVGFCRSLGIPARDVYGIRVAPSRLGYKSLGASSEVISKSQHCRAEFFAQGIGWVPVDPADVRKVILEEPPGHLSPEDAKVEAAHKRLFGSWEMNWLALNFGQDVELPGSKGPKLPFLMYPNGETGGERLDELDPDRFRYTITSHQA